MEDKFGEMKQLIFLIFCCTATVAARSQNTSATASQTIVLELNPTLDLRFTNTQASAGPVVSLDFNSLANYTDGVVSGVQELEVRSNRSFKISVQTDAPSFTYSGPTQSGTSMPVDQTLFMSVSGNNTGGSIASGFSNFVSLTSSSQDLILNGMQGSERTLSLAYKAKPALGFAAGNYAVGVIYTATQP